jgi:acyl-CoA synthetase (NDP forming)
VHKTDAGGVILGLRSAAELATAVETLAARMSGHGMVLEKVFLQREVQGGIEALVGVTTDPTFGPLVICGMGGTLVELVEDASFHLPPVSDLDARAMIAKLRSARVFDGYRGSPPADREALARMIERVSALAEVVPELRELDLNPVKVLPVGRGAVAVDGRMRIAPTPHESVT